jgi:hypothetical protein
VKDLELQDLRQRFSSLSQTYDEQSSKLNSLEEMLHERGLIDKDLDDTGSMTSLSRDLSELKTTVHR